MLGISLEFSLAAWLQTQAHEAPEVEWSELASSVADHL
jgi:hypothetical protein